MALCAAALCVAGMAQSHIHLRFTWQATIFHIPSFTHNFVTHYLSHTTLSHTIFHTPSFTHNFVTHNLSHTTLSQTIFHTPSFTHNFVTHHLSHTTKSHTIFHTRGTISRPPSFCVAGVAQSHIYLRFAWQAWHLWHCVARLVAVGRRWSPVTPRHFAWQAWHNLTSTFVSRGRRGTISHPPSFCVAGVALMGLCGALGRRWSPVTPRHFALQAWHNLTSTFVSRGRRGTVSHPPSFCVAGVALMGLCGALGRRWSPVTPRHFLTSTFVLRGRRGAYGTVWRAWSPSGDAAALCVAGVAQSHIHLCVTWQAWHNLTSTFVLRGRRGTYGTVWRAWSPLVAGDAAALCVAGVAQSHIHLCVTWQATIFHIPSFTHNFVTHYLSHTTLSHTIFHTPSFTHNFVTHNLSHTTLSQTIFHTPSFTHNFVTHHLSHTTKSHTIFHTRGTISRPPSFCVAGVAQSHIYLRFAWQAWHLWHCVARLVAVGRRWSPVTPRHFAWQAWHNLTSTFVSRGWRGTISHPPSFCVAGVALMGLCGAPLCHRSHTIASYHATALCVAGVAPSHIHHRFTWQAWHFVTSTIVLRGRRGTYGTVWRATPSFTHHL